MPSVIINVICCCLVPCIQCFDTVGWKTGRGQVKWLPAWFSFITGS